jgi:hypothetical protein
MIVSLWSGVEYMHIYFKMCFLYNITFYTTLQEAIKQETRLSLIRLDNADSRLSLSMFILRIMLPLPVNQRR